MEVSGKTPRSTAPALPNRGILSTVNADGNKEFAMSSEKITHIGSSKRPRITTYDSGYEHSLEHLMDLQLLLAAGEEEASVTAPARAPEEAAKPAARAIGKAG